MNYQLTAERILERANRFYSPNNQLQSICQKWSARRLPQLDGRIYLRGLTHKVTIGRDNWGIPHLHAANRGDLVFAQGFVHAQDRLWQMELNRRAATGTLSAVFGQITLDSDRLSRTLGFARLARITWQKMAGQMRADLEAYSAGVNAFLQTEPRLPVEFSLLRYRPEPWQVMDSIAYARLQMWTLTHGAIGELVYAQLIDRVGPEKAAELGLAYPPENPVTLPDGIEVHRLQLDQMIQATTAAFLGKGVYDGAGRGSNAWVIGPQLSASGHPILSSDMHLPVGTPSLWHGQHLRSDDGYHVTGFTLPGLPYVMAGHNGRIAWGATLSYTDCEDLFVEKLHPEDDGRYRFRDDWRQAELFEERIPVRGGEEQVERVIVTHHGPIISQVIESDRQTVALASTALHPDAGVDGFGWLNQAHNWDQFVTAVSRIDAPSLNLLYADVDGNIGHYVSGRVPIRAQGDGLLPAPGWTGQHEWAGFIPFAEMPHALNPKRGYIVSANHRIVDEKYPHYLGRVWRNGYRAARIEQLITGRQAAADPPVKISVADCARFQMDVLCLPGLELVAHLRHLHPDDPDAALTLRLLREWNGRLEIESIGGAIYHVFLTHLTTAILWPPALAGAESAPPDFVQKLLGLGPHPILAPVNEFAGQWLATLLSLLKKPETAWLPTGEARQALFVRCLAATTAELRRLLGHDPAGWQWGRLHRVTFGHALGVQPPLDLIFNQGPYPVGGDGNTVCQTGIRPDQPYNNNAISVSSRHIVDMGDVANAQAIHPPGQSGHLASPHYGDLIEPWLAGEYYPLLWEDEAITAACRHILSLSPHLD